ncbi:MAG: SIR2 family protein [Endomicrobium sp.]|jgi:hypothetical protein|nr:SIR2 family protein [Endomicrobium sp.]
MEKPKEISDVIFKRFIESGNINLLIGSGCSLPYIKTLGNIEEEMNSPDEEKKLAGRTKYYELINKSKAVLNGEYEKDGELKEVKNNYDSFLKCWLEIILKRKSSILNKQINIFTTNFDIFIENSCERMKIIYNDGFSGRIKPVFDAANFNRIQKYKTLQFDNISDIPVFNIIKIHGSVSWKKEEKSEEIVYSDGSHIEDDLLKKDNEEFKKGYDKILVVNPNAEKHFETVLDTNYAALLRKFVLELEKENSILLIFGFSLKDKHIKELLFGVLKANPTLNVIYFSHKKCEDEELLEREGTNPNFFIKENISFGSVSEFLNKVFNFNHERINQDYVYYYISDKNK